MKLQAITFAAVVTSFFVTSNADAGKFNLGNVIRTAQKIDQQLNRGGGKITYPSPNPPKYTHPVEPPHHIYPIPVEPPHCKKPAPPICKKPTHPPINRPPAKCLTLKLINKAGAEVYFVINNADDYTTLPAGENHWLKTMNPQPHTISYHNGQQMVEFELSADGTYSFEWEGDTLQLYEVQG